MRRLIALVVITLSACAPVEAQPTATPTATATETPTPTATIVWFPPTDTPTPRPMVTATATPDMRPGISSIAIFEEDFDSAVGWQLNSGGDASAAIANNHLTLSLSQNKSVLYAPRLSPSLDNFYAEIMAAPSLCRGNDEFGVLVRYGGSTNHYRIGFTCNGQAKFDRVLNSIRTSLVPADRYGIIPNAAPSQMTIGIWANGREIRVFVNDIFLYSATDSAFRLGLIGAYVSSNGGQTISVNFSDLKVYPLTSP